MPTSTLSSAVRSVNSRRFWKVRAMPACTIACGRRPSSVRPRNATLPSSGFRKPVMTLKIVVLPAPFGPTRQVMRPCSMVKLHSRSARKPPKR